ncbi:hypothetical protein [Duganella sp. S19_KUP01_CR8]|uniref:hypothetical protein n=1 Tax=Duganella sp. S19_KUP01_CR8 TaxID=3025502 RepID=UPI002FCD91C8
MTARSMLSPPWVGESMLLLFFQDGTQRSGSQVVLFNYIQSNTSYGTGRVFTARIDMELERECERPPTGFSKQKGRNCALTFECLKLNIVLIDEYQFCALWKWY